MCAKENFFLNPQVITVPCCSPLANMFTPESLLMGREGLLGQPPIPKQLHLGLNFGAYEVEVICTNLSGTRAGEGPWAAAEHVWVEVFTKKMMAHSVLKTSTLFV